MRRLAITAALAPWLFVACRVRAASLPDDETASLPCRPTIACTADIVRPGLFELESGMLFRRLAEARQWSFPFLAKLTIATFAQLQLGSNGFTSQFDGTPARYFDDLSPGIKLHLVDQELYWPSVSVSGAVSVPVDAHQEGYRAATDLSFIAYVTKDFGPVHADLNVGANDLGLGPSARAQEWIALAISAPLPRPFGVMVENYYFADAAPFASRDGGCLFAISVTPRPWLVFDFGGDAGYFPSTRAYSTFVGMTIVPVRLWP